MDTRKKSKKGLRWRKRRRMKIERRRDEDVKEKDIWKRSEKEEEVIWMMRT